MDDISNIRVTTKANQYLDRLVTEQKLFKDDKTAAQFGLAYAIKNNLDAHLSDEAALNGETVNKWDALSIDTSGVLRLLIKERHPAITCPFRVLQAVMNIGLEKMADLSPQSGVIKISDFMK